MTNISRDLVAGYIVNEVFGPTTETIKGAIPLPEPDAKGIFHIAEEHSGLKIFDPTSGQLILQGTSPQNAYGTGVLHAPERWEDLKAEKAENGTPVSDPEFEIDEVPEAQVDTVGGRGPDTGDESFSLEESQKVRPSALGMTAIPTLFDNDTIVVRFSGAVYQDIQMMYGQRGPVQAWRRKEISGEHRLQWQSGKYVMNSLYDLSFDGDCQEFVSLKIRFRESDNLATGSNSVIATIVVKNKAQSSKNPDVFQSKLDIEIIGEGAFGDSTRKASSNLEQQELDHLYRHSKVFGTGHGTAVEWHDDGVNAVKKLSSAAIPTFYQEVLDFDALESISMRDLGLSDRTDVANILKRFMTGYQAWIEAESQKSLGDPSAEREVIHRLKSKAEHILARIQKGYSMVCEGADSTVFEAFQLANLAMFEQQKNGKRKVRKWERGENVVFSIPEGEEPTGHFGTWRPFQIAFLLAVIPGLVDGNDPSRDEVDLIFFPTGGGKTEAYLGASAFSIVYRRLSSDPQEVLGVDVIMRYTLRLLTIQQFERSAGLIAALELMRQKEPGRLGGKPISIGVWLGSKTTPNYRSSAIQLLKDTKDRKESDANPFVLSKCPVCAAEFGWEERKPKGMWRGYAKLPSIGSGATLRFLCPDRNCEFGDSENPLPIWITDEDIYNEQPSFILGTVDKFAQMAWVPEAKRIFNIGSDGIRKGPAPSLIIQDELHLISGPLGSMVGLYEPVIEALCTDTRFEKPIRPKIIASTATTRNYASQCKRLYGRETVMLFPQAIDRVNETYFSQVMVNKETGEKEKGSLFLGINPATYGSAQTSAARLAAILKQAPNMVPDVNDKSMDYYRTSVWFFNSLKELGMTLTLMQSVTRDMIGGLRKAKRLPDGVEKASYPFRILELTSRIDSDKVSSALTRLGKPIVDPESYDTCLASSIMEVGVDVPRLGLLTIMAQPKTTSQYIQVSGRVGRDRQNGPGLVVMLYNAKRSRDRSIYERFQSYHESVYAQVEPISVTPFAIEAMQHGLKGAVISLYRMTTPDSATPQNVDWVVFEAAVQVLRERISSLDASNQSKLDFEKQIESLRQYWKAYSPSDWGYTYAEQYIKHDESAKPALMRDRREPLYPQIAGDKSILIMTSMRSVDGQTRLEIQSPYAFLEGDD